MQLARKPAAARVPRLMLVLTLALPLMTTIALPAQQAPETLHVPIALPRAIVPEPHARFARVRAGEIIERHFTLRNEGGAPLRLIKTDMTAPLRPTRLASAIAPGSEAQITFRLDTTRLAGPYEGEIILDTDDPVRPEIHLTFEGEVTPLVEFSPAPMFFVSAVRGEQRAAAIEITNHQDEPLEIVSVNNPSTRFTTSLEMLEPGRRHRLTLNMLADGIGGKRSEVITLKTTSARYSQLRIAANTLIKERVYTAPEKLDFGLIPAAALAPDSPLSGMLEQTLMVYQAVGTNGGGNFELQATSEQPYVAIAAERGSGGSQYQLRVRLLPEKFPAGILQGSIHLATNDPEFPQLDIPFSAVLE